MARQKYYKLLNKMEIWKDVKGFEGIYVVSSLGKIKGIDRISSNGKLIKGRILKQSKNKFGYLLLGLSKNGTRKTFQTHRLVAEAFIPNPENKPEIDHINTIKDDNRVENLRWVTHEENMNNKLSKDKISEINSGENHPMYGKKHSKETKSKMSKSHEGKINNKPRRIYCIELDKIYNSIREAEKELNISRTHIIKACKDINKSAGKHPVTKEKLHWRYL